MDLAAGVFQLFDATSKKPKASIPLSQIHELQKSEARDFAFEFKVICDRASASAPDSVLTDQSSSWQAHTHVL